MKELKYKIIKNNGAGVFCIGPVDAPKKYSTIEYTILCKKDYYNDSD